MKLALALASAALTVAAFGSAAGASSSVHNGRIAFVHGSSTGGYQIYSVTAAGTGERELTHSHRWSSGAPSYSPDGRRIVFARAYGSRVDLWTMNANGTEHRRLTWTKRIVEWNPSWSPDGAEIVFSVEYPVAQQGLWIVGADSGKRRRLTTGFDTHPRWSPDGTEVVFQRSGTSGTPWQQVYLVPAAGGTATNLTNNMAIDDEYPSWSPDSSHIIFSSDRQDGHQLDLWVMNADGTGAHQITHTVGRDESDASWSPDGLRIVYSSHGSSSEQLQVARRSGAHARYITHSCGGCTNMNSQPTWQPLR